MDKGGDEVDGGAVQSWEEGERLDNSNAKKVKLTNEALIIITVYGEGTMDEGKGQA